MIPFNTIVFPENKSLPKDLSVWGKVSFLPRYFWQVAASLLYRSGPAKQKTVGVRLVPNDVSVPFADCRSNWRHSEYYSCQTDITSRHCRKSVDNYAKDGRRGVVCPSCSFYQWSFEALTFYLVRYKAHIHKLGSNSFSETVQTKASSGFVCATKFCAGRKKFEMRSKQNDFFGPYSPVYELFMASTSSVKWAILWDIS